MASSTGAWPTDPSPTATETETETETTLTQGHEACVAYLLDAGADITATDEHDYTALHLASYYGRVGVVALLLRSVVDTVYFERGGGKGRKEGDGDTTGSGGVGIERRKCSSRSACDPTTVFFCVLLYAHSFV